MKKAFIHIGLPHAASTHLEYFFLDPGAVDVFAPTNLSLQQRVGRDFRLSYLENPRPGVMTPELQRSREEYVLPLLDNDDVKAIIFSEEHFTDPLKYKEMVPLLGQYLEGFDVKVIFVVRRQDSWLESFYSQQIKDGGTSTFSLWLEQLNLDDYHWLDYADAYAEEYNTRVVPLGDSGNDIAVDVFASIGVGIQFESQFLINPSLPMHYTEVLRVANVILKKPEDRKKLADVMVEGLIHTTDHKSSNDYFTTPWCDTTREEIVKFYQEKNDMLLKKYLPTDVMR